MSVELQALETAVADFDRDADDDFVDPRRLSAAIDRLQGKLCRVVSAAKQRGEHLVAGQSACSWVAAQCQISKTSAADRLCVGEQLSKLPEIAQALSSGQIGYQAAAVICHLSDQVGEKRQYIDEEHWIGYAQRFSIKDLRYLTYEARVRWDCEGFERQTEEDYGRRSLDISETIGGMYRLDAWLDPLGGAALKAAIESLSNPLGTADHRTAKQRRADALVEAMHHAMGAGTLPRRHGARTSASTPPSKASRANSARPHHSSTAGCRSRARRCSGWPVMELSIAFLSPTRSSWTSVERRGRSRLRSGELSRRGIGPARLRSVTGRST